MKLPFDFSLALFFRLVLPGTVLAAILLPAVHTLAAGLGFPLPLGISFPVEVVGWGVVVVLADQPIFLICQGRRFWPQAIRNFGLKRQERLCRELLKRSAKKHKARDRQRWLEANIGLLDFPFRPETLKRRPTLPTRLGNLIAAYETYPDDCYGMDGAFYWYRVLVKLDKDLRGELDQAQAVADCAIYLSFVFAVGVIMGLAYLTFSRFLLQPFDIEYTPKPGSLVALVVLAAFLSRCLYELGIHVQRQYGEFFKAVFDQFHADLSFVDEVAGYVGQNGGQLYPDRTEKLALAWHFLRWNQILPRGTKRYVKHRAAL